MPTCKQREASYVEYVCDLLGDLQIASLEAHLEDCANCRQYIRLLKKVLRLTDSAEAEISSVTGGFEDIEMKVYKRLAAEPGQLTPRAFPSRFAHRLRLSVYGLTTALVTHRMFSINVTQGWRSALEGCTLVLAMIISSVFFDGKQSTTIPLASIEVAPTSERIEQYRWQGIRRTLEDALVMKHLRNDDWEATSRLRMLNEQAQGTRYEQIANRQLQITPVLFR